MSTWLTNNRAFESLFRAAPIGIVALDDAGRVVDANEAWSAITGYAQGDIAGRDMRSLLHPDARALIDEALAHDRTLQREGELVRADGTPIAAQFEAIPIPESEEPARIFFTAKQIPLYDDAKLRRNLLELESDFRSLFERNPDGIILVSPDGIILDSNQATLDFGGRTRDDIIGQHFREFLQGLDLERAWAFFRRALDGESVRFELLSSRVDGTPLPLDITLFPKYGQGEIAGVYAVMQDITERKLANRKLELQTQRIRDLYLLATTPEYTDSHVMSTLQTGCRLLGIESGAIVDITEGPRVELRYDSLALFSGDDAQVLQLANAVISRREAVASHVSDEPVPGEYRSWIGSRLTVGGTLHGALVFFSNTRRDQPFEEIDHDTLALMAALVSSALERRRTRSHLRTLAYYDSLTGLPNRAFFQERLRDALLDPKGTPQPLAVLFFDLDRFKDINESLGHAMGDRFLQLVAHRLVVAVGEDGVVARMGGDEFVVLAHGCSDEESASALAASLLRTIDEPYKLDGYEQFMTSSVGISLYPNDGRDDQTLIKNADIAMYQAKDRGGNAYFFYEESLEAPMRTRLAKEKDLRKAIERNQFVLQYQPIIDVATDRIVGAEALVRWNDPRRKKIVMPDEFIPMAEATGLIISLGERILASGASQLREWRERFGDLTLAINISARQFHQPDLCDRLLEILAASGLAPGSIELEITESMALSDVALAIEAVRQIKTIGVRIAVDDFGTGHSSLNYLRRFDIDNIKIDRSFVAGIGTERSDETIVKAIIAMGHSLGLTVVAEGVETREQYEFLRTHGCDRVQGYLFSRPIDAPAFEALLLQRGTQPNQG